MTSLRWLLARIAIALAGITVGSATWGSAREVARLPGSRMELVESAGFEGGVIVVADFDRAELLVELTRTEGRFVHGLSNDPRLVAEARRELHRAGLAGRGAVAHWSGTGLPYAEDFVNLLFTDARHEVAAEEISRVLVPGGVAFILILGVWGEIGGGSGARDGSEVFVTSGERLFLPLELRAPVSALDAATGRYCEPTRAWRRSKRSWFPATLC